MIRLHDLSQGQTRCRLPVQSFAGYQSFMRTLIVVLGGLLLARPAAAQAIPAWIVADTAGKTVQLDLHALRTADGKLTLNGEREGSIQIIVPQRWTIRWTWKNEDSLSNRSLIVMTEREKLPEQAGRPAFTNAVTRSPVAGLAVGQKDVSEFEADEGGWFWILGGVPAHAIGGEYIGLRVDPAAAGVSVKRKAS
jgi:hypothetical protein